MYYANNPLLNTYDMPPAGYRLVPEGRLIIREGDMVFVEKTRQWEPVRGSMNLVGARVETDGVLGVAARIH